MSQPGRKISWRLKDKRKVNGFANESWTVKDCLHISYEKPSLWHHTQDGLRHIAIFPKHTIIAWGNIKKKGLER